jgi:hypothetical protein
MKGNKGVNLGLNRVVRDKKNATYFMVIKTIPVTLAECFPDNSSFDNRVSVMVITRAVS